MAVLILSATYTTPTAANHTTTVMQGESSGNPNARFWVKCSCGYRGASHGARSEADQDQAFHLNSAVSPAMATYQVKMHAVRHLTRNPGGYPLQLELFEIPGSYIKLWVPDCFRREMAIDPLTAGLVPVQHDLHTCEFEKRPGVACNVPMNEDQWAMSVARFAKPLCLHHYQFTKNGGTRT